tara:strand:- start:36235 stop:37482 length:1248 start_codon:yes stop_codon:yes gene_type:complete
MKDNNDDGVHKVNLATTQPDATDDTVHKVDLSKPPSGDGDQGDDQDDAAADDANDQNNNQDDDQNDDDQSGTDDSDDADDAADDNDADDDDDSHDDSQLEDITDVDDADDADDAGDADDADDTSQDDDQNDNSPALPENIQKLADFINDTGGTIEDYVKLNKDIDSLDERQLLREYHQSLEPSLDAEELDIIMEDLYDSDEDEDSEREIKKKGITKKRDLTKAKKHLQGIKDKYYEEIKAGSSLTPDQKKAVDFFNRHSEVQETDLKSRTQKQKVFTEKTDKLFNEDFKGFEFKVGEKRYRYNVKDVAGTKKTQSSIENFTKKYLGDDNALNDEKGYHKAIFTAMNADAIAEHFYKQGGADAVKNSAANKKNIDMGNRKAHDKNVPSTGKMKARVVTADKGQSTGKLKFKSFKKG